MSHRIVWETCRTSTWLGCTCMPGLWVSTRKGQTDAIAQAHRVAADMARHRRAVSNVR